MSAQDIGAKVAVHIYSKLALVTREQNSKWLTRIGGSQLSDGKVQRQQHTKLMQVLVLLQEMQRSKIAWSTHRWLRRAKNVLRKNYTSPLCEYHTNENCHCLASRIEDECWHQFQLWQTLWIYYTRREYTMIAASRRTPHTHTHIATAAAASTVDWEWMKKTHSASERIDWGEKYCCDYWRCVVCVLASRSVAATAAQRVSIYTMFEFLLWLVSKIRKSFTVPCESLGKHDALIWRCCVCVCQR